MMLWLLWLLVLPLLLAGCSSLRLAGSVCGEPPPPPPRLAPPQQQVLLIGDSISMGYNFLLGHPTPCPRASKCQPGKIECGCQPDNRLGYGLYVRQMLANSSSAPLVVQHSGGWYAGGQAGDTVNGVNCIHSWLGTNHWSVIVLNFGLHDIYPSSNASVPLAAYRNNLRKIVTVATATGAQLLWVSTTPVPTHTKTCGRHGKCRTEADVQRYNHAALAELAPDIASGAVSVLDLHAQIIAACGGMQKFMAGCPLQIPGNIHYEHAGRLFCARAVAAKVREMVTAAAVAVVGGATTFYIETDGDNAGDGQSAYSAWQSVDRGQPVLVRVRIPAGGMQLSVERAWGLPDSGAAMVGHGARAFAVAWQNRSGTVLFLQARVPRAVQVGEAVVPSLWEVPGAGDTIMIGEGVHTLNTWVDAQTAEAGAVYAVAVIRGGGNATRPLTLRGASRSSVLDGRFIGNALSLQGASHVQILCLHLRRGSLVLMQTAYMSLERVDVSEVRSWSGVTVAYSDHVTVSNSTFRNVLYNNMGTCFSVGYKTTNFSLTKSTILSCDHGIRISGNGPDFSDYDRPDVLITQNLVIGSRFASLAVDHGVRLARANVQGNLLLVAGRQSYLNATGANLYYSTSTWLGNPGARHGNPFLQDLNNQSFIPNDLHVDPQLINMEDDSSPFWLAVTPESVCASEFGERLIGAGRVASSPDPQFNNNLLVNSDFARGMYGWTLSGDFDRGDRGNSSWARIRTTSSAALQMCTSPLQQATGGSYMVQVMARSMSVVVRRDFNLTVSFAARAWILPGTHHVRDVEASPPAPSRVGFEACLYVPSWQDRSRVCNAITVAADHAYHNFSTVLRLPAWWPSTTAVEIRTLGAPYASCMEFDHISLTQSARSLTNGDKQASVEVTLEGNVSLGLIPPLSTLKLLVVTANSVPRLSLPWQLRDPAARVVADGVIDAPGLVAIPLRANATGALLLSFEDTMLRSIFVPPIRLFVGAPVPRVHDPLSTFAFAATPRFPSLQLSSEQRMATQLAQLAAFGLNSLHYYPSTERMAMMMSEPWVTRLMQASKRVGIAWLMTLSGRHLFLPGYPHQASWNVTTDAQLAVWTKIVAPFARWVCEWVSWFEVMNEPNGVGLTGDQYVRILRNTSAAVRRTCPSSQVLGGCVVCGDGFMGIPNKSCDCCEIWSATVKNADEFDQVSFHPYRFYNRDPETDGDGEEKPASTPWTFRRMMQQAVSELPVGKGVFLTEEGQGPELSSTRMIPMSLSYNSNARTQAWTQGEALQAFNYARMLVTAIGEGASGYCYSELPNLLVDAENTPLLSLCSVHTVASLGLGRAGVLKTQLNLGANSGWIGYSFDLVESGSASTVVAIWPRDAQYAVLTPIVFKEDDDSDEFIGNTSADPSALSVLTQFGNSVPVESLGHNSWSFQLDRAVHFVRIRSGSKQRNAAIARLLARALTSNRDGPVASVVWPTVPGRGE